ncbi:hypothetical protein GCM10026982_12440 [Nocardiopsis aegyptia]
MLDSAVHPDGVWRDVVTLQAPAYPAANVERYARWPAEHDDVYELGSTPEEVVAAFEETSWRPAEDPREDVSGRPEGVAFGQADWDDFVGTAARYQGYWVHRRRGDPRPRPALPAVGTGEADARMAGGPPGACPPARPLCDRAARVTTGAGRPYRGLSARSPPGSPRPGRPGRRPGTGTRGCRRGPSPWGWGRRT